MVFTLPPPRYAHLPLSFSQGEKTTVSDYKKGEKRDRARRTN